MGKRELHIRHIGYEYIPDDEIKEKTLQKQGGT